MKRTVNPDYLIKRQQKFPLAPRPEIYDVQHFKMHYNKNWYCGHPRQSIFNYFGSGEIIVAHNHALCNYQVPSDVGHDLGGYHSRATILLQRSTDGGRTWPEEHNVCVYDETISSEEKRDFLYQEDAPRFSYIRPASQICESGVRRSLPPHRAEAETSGGLRSNNPLCHWQLAASATPLIRGTAELANTPEKGQIHKTQSRAV